MALARSLDGVISGEHGIGITKLEFLSDAELQPFTDYKGRVDPEGRFNKGKLMRQPAPSFTAGPPQGETRPLGGQRGHASAERGGR